MPCLEVLQAEVTHPTGDPNFAVMQAFPAAVPAEVADPFLMCDEFGPSVSKGPITDPDKFPVGWHPHLGMDIMTYLREGKGRHADSLGNYGSYESPGLQWISVGSGIEHAEGGGTPKGERQHGFQIWINVPGDHKYDEPRYGTNGPETIPLLQFNPTLDTSTEAKFCHDPSAVGGEAGGPPTARLLAGQVGDHEGPFKTTQPVQILDFTVPANKEVHFRVAPGLDTALCYCYSAGKSGAVVSGQRIRAQSVARMDSTDETNRTVVLEGGEGGLGVMLFAGKRIKEPIAWHGPFVMNSRDQLTKAFREYQTGEFPPTRVPWDYRRPSENMDKLNMTH